jgi:hypothetical protein
MQTTACIQEGCILPAWSAHERWMAMTSKVQHKGNEKAAMFYFLKKGISISLHFSLCEYMCGQLEEFHSIS